VVTQHQGGGKNVTVHPIQTNGNTEHEVIKRQISYSATSTAGMTDDICITVHGILLTEVEKITNSDVVKMGHPLQCSIVFWGARSPTCHCNDKH